MRDPLERVTNLLTLLLERRAALTLQQICDQLGDWYQGSPVAVRAAFERDKAMLRDIGVPIEMEVLGGDQAGQTAYRLDRDRFELRGLDLDDDERHAVQTAVAAVRSEVGQEGVWKLGGAVGGLSAVIAELPALPALPALRAASSDHTTVEISYHGTRRRLDPYGLLLRHGLWYVVGLDASHDSVRTFRVDRIEGDVEVLAGERFERPVGFDAGAAFPDDPKAIGEGDDHALVWIDAAIAATVRRELGEHSIAGDRADGSVEVRVPCSNLGAFRSWVLGLGVRAEVLGPEPVRAHIVEWLEHLVAGTLPSAHPTETLR